MEKSRSSTWWNPCRFLKTLAYFGAIPFLSDIGWVQQGLGSQVNPIISRNNQDSMHNCIFDFRSSSSPSGVLPSNTDSSLDGIWGAVDDVVMGGVSASRIESATGSVLFTGIVSTANSGGFASVRTRNFDPPLDLSAHSGIRLRVNGDGQRYKFLLRDAAQWDGIAYAYSFDTVANTWLTVDIPFEDMVPVFRARTMDSTTPHLNQEHVRALQFMLSKFEYDGELNPTFKAGSFHLYIETICTY